MVETRPPGLTDVLSVSILSMLFYSNKITPRLEYIADFIGRELTGKPALITSDPEVFKEQAGPKLNYSESSIAPGEIRIHPHPLLFEKNIQVQQTKCGSWQKKPIFFETDGDLPFDLFAATFFLLTRYEEYLPHDQDMYGRYDHRNALAWKNGFLNLPLINYWLQFLSTEIRKKMPSFDPVSHRFSFLPTYDIDMAWSYRHKGFWRTVGGMSKDLFTGNFSELFLRLQVMFTKKEDPFHAYEWMNRIHDRYGLKPYYFFLMAEKPGRYDKNIPRSCHAFESLIREHAARYPIGIHPSWQSGDRAELIGTEIAALSRITGGAIRSSRQHYIRFKLPETFRLLIDNGIQFDFSMGYGAVNGFRASVATPFHWYDLENEKQTQLMLFPFCFMDANSFYEQQQSPELALEQMREYYTTVKEVNGVFSMIWHNSFLGTDKKFGGWREAYKTFLTEISENKNAGAD
jgi:hypothetical protein